MNPIPQQDPEAKQPSNLMDVLIRAALITALAVLCYQVFLPFLPLMAWSIILAVTMYPVHQWVARGIGGRPRLASMILVIISFLLIVIPTGLLMNSFADSVKNFIDSVKNNALEIPVPPERVARWPIIGNKVHDVWLKAHADLPGLVQSMQPKIGDLAQKALAVVASIGGSLLLFLGSFIVASIIMAYGESASSAGQAIFRRVAGLVRGEALSKLSTGVIRSVALGVIGVAFVQSTLIGLVLLLAGIPAAGVLSIIAFVLGIAQVPAVIVLLPVIIYIWSSGGYSNPAAITYTVILLLTGLVDNILKPLMLGRGVNVPMPVILFGALGGIASGGILGMFVGATVLSLGYEIFKAWVASNPDYDPKVKKEELNPGELKSKT